MIQQKIQKMSLKNYLHKHYSSTSIKGYENMIRRYRAVMGEGIAKANYTEVLEYIGILRKENLHPKSLRNNLFAIKIYFNYLLEIGKIQEHPCKHLYLSLIHISEPTRPY